MMVFLHGGSWRSGDRSAYPLFGNRFAKAGIGVAIPSYRLMPKNPHPAQIEDAAAAFAWVYKNIAKYGGDATRIYMAGHSAGGHLAALLALDPQYLENTTSRSARSMASRRMSGVYDVGSTRRLSRCRRRRSVADRARACERAAVSDHLLPVGLSGLAEAGSRFRGGAEKEIRRRGWYVPGESHIPRCQQARHLLGRSFTIVKDDRSVIRARAILETDPVQT